MSAMVDANGAYVILAVESQSYIDYSMPVRAIMYDAIQYAKQVKEIAAKHKLEGTHKGISSDEFLSGFYKSDNLLPVITLVIYFADKEWDGPMSLHEMFKEKDEHLMSFVSDYKLNLIAPAFLREEDCDLFHSSLKKVLLFIKYSKNKEKVKELVENDEAFHHMDREAVEVINICTGAQLPVKEDEEAVDMCQAIKELMEDAAAEAKAEGKAEGEVLGTFKAIQSLMNSMKTSAEQAMKILEIPESEIQQYLELLQEQR
jgi:hypothetical protein